MVGHQGIAFIADSVLLGVNLAQPSRLFATILADCLATTLAIVLEDHTNAAKGLTAEHAGNGSHFHIFNDIVKFRPDTTTIRGRERG